MRWFRFVCKSLPICACPLQNYLEFRLPGLTPEKTISKFITRWWKDRLDEQAEALEFVEDLLNADIPRICLENPIGKISTAICKPSQIIQPWQYGHGETKATCLWLKNLPLLRSTDVVSGREARVHRMAPGPNRWRERSRTFLGVAEAMASQWGNLRILTPTLAPTVLAA